jgi:hypothetical protein
LKPFPLPGAERSFKPTTEDARSPPQWPEKKIFGARYEERILFDKKSKM